MKKAVSIVALGVAFLASALAWAPSADARPRTVRYAAECGVSMPCEGVGLRSYRAGQSDRRVARQARFSGASASTSLAHVEPQLAAKAQQIIASCPGAKIISTIRHTRIAGSGGALSKHASGNAVDIMASKRTQAAYACILSHLHSWPSHSSDGVRCHHIHISNGEPKGFRHHSC